MRLIERLRAAFAAFKNGPIVVAVRAKPTPSELQFQQYMLSRQEAKERAIGLLEPQSRFVAIRMIGSKEMPWQYDIDILVDGLRLLDDESRFDAMQALCEAVPPLILNTTFKALTKGISAYTADRNQRILAGNPAE